MLTTFFCLADGENEMVWNEFSNQKCRTIHKFPIKRIICLRKLMRPAIHPFIFCLVFFCRFLVWGFIYFSRTDCVIVDGYKGEVSRKLGHML